MGGRCVAGRGLRAYARIAVLVLIAGCSSARAEDSSTNARIEFGIWVEAPRGEFVFVATDQVPNVEDQAYGWRVRVDDPHEPVKWIESMTLPTAPESWEGVGENPNAVVSPDGRTSTMIGVTEPVDGYVGNIWSVAIGDPPGDYEMEVELGDGRKARFRFRVGEAPGGAEAI